MVPASTINIPPVKEIIGNTGPQVTVTFQRNTIVLALKFCKMKPFFQKSHSL